jgi:glycopeptide antibiotics resistance protein
VTDRTAAWAAEPLRRRPPLLRVVPFLLLAVYLAVVAALTLGPGDPDVAAVDNFVPFATIDRAQHSGSLLGLLQVIGNGLLFVPFGFLAPLAFPRLRVFTAVLVAALVSAAVEIVQLTHLAGRIFDVDDVILNVAGACAGGLLAAIWRGVAALLRMARARSQRRADRASASPAET